MFAHPGEQIFTPFGQNILSSFYVMQKYLTNIPKKLHISNSHWKPSSSRSHQHNVFSHKHPIYSGETNKFEKFVNAFARSKPAGSWTRQECLAEARKIWNSEICLRNSSKINDVDEQKLGLWLEQYPPPLSEPKTYLPKKARTDLVDSETLQSQTVSLQTACPTSETNVSPTLTPFGNFLQSTSLQNLMIAWEIDVNKMADVCFREPTLHTVLQNVCNHFLKFGTLSKELEIVFRTGKRDVTAKSKFRSELKSYTSRIIDAKTNLNSGVNSYFACMRSGITENLSSDFLSSKLQLSTVMHLLSTLGSEISQRNSSKNSLLSSMAKRLQESTQKIGDEPFIIANTYCSKSWDEVMVQIQLSEDTQQSN